MQIKSILGRLKFWYVNARPVSLPQSMLPALTAVVIAAGEPSFSLPLAVLAVLGAALAHLSMNLFDDYFDYRKLETGFRDTLAAQGFRARTAKCPYLTSGEATVRELLLACVGFGAAAVFCGFWIFLFRGTMIICPVALCVILGISYSGDPLRLSYRGLGEAVIGVIFGPLLMSGVYMSACGQINPALMLAACALGLLVTNILYTHSVLDYEADQFAGKSTLAGLLKTKERMLKASAVFSFLPFLLILFGIIVRWFSPWWLLVVLALPQAAALYRSMQLFTERPKFVPERHFWYGPMANWQKIRQAGIDWFMLRWYLSRNLTTGFAICCMLAAILA